MYGALAVVMIFAISAFAFSKKKKKTKKRPVATQTIGGGAVATEKTDFASSNATVKIDENPVETKADKDAPLDYKRPVVSNKERGITPEQEKKMSKLIITPDNPFYNQPKK